VDKGNGEQHSNAEQHSTAMQNGTAQGSAEQQVARAFHRYRAFESSESEHVQCAACTTVLGAEVEMPLSAVVYIKQDIQVGC
jgi:hypothetical protein